jgi:Leucine-rich repeat (LRR) protein
MMSIQSKSPLFFLDFPEEIQAQVIMRCNPAQTQTAMVCKAWKAAALSDFTLLFWLEKQASELGFTSVINKAKEIALEDDKNKFILSKFFSRINKPVPSGTIAHNFIYMQRLLTKEKAENLRIVCDVIALQMPKLSDYLKNSEFSVASLVKQGTLLKAFLVANQDECAKITQLELIEKNLSHIPEELELFPNLEVLNLSINNIDSLNPNLGRNWNNLKSLYLRSNKITEIPMGFGSSWRNLKELNLFDNKIDALREDFGNSWENLKTIDIAHNPLVSPPRLFGSKWNSLFSITFKSIKKLDPDTGVNWTELMFLYVYDTNLRNDLESHKRKWPSLRYSN